MQPEDLQTIDDLLNADWADLLRLNKKDLQRVISHYAIIANARRTDALSKLRASNLPTPSVYKSSRAKDGSTNVSWYNYGFNYRRGSNTDEMRKKLRLLKQFFSDKTTTFEGWEESLNKFTKTVERDTGIVISKRKYKQFWNLYLKAQEHAEVRAKLQSNENGSAQILRQIIDIIELDNKIIWDEDTVIERMRRQLKIDKEEIRKRKMEELDYIDNETDEDTDNSSFDYNPFI